ncbi:MAG TPA: hypothetical protein VHF26_19565, partial [Trebonia sp.]|nr:hypothetical protein [Trebonia sp.]
MPANEIAANQTAAEGTSQPPAATPAGVAGARAGAGEARSGGTSVSLRGLTRVFGATRALDAMSLEIAPGELV